MNDQLATQKTERARRRARLDEIGEASFPASDPPQSWTWDPRERREQASQRFQPAQEQPAPAR